MSDVFWTWERGHLPMGVFESAEKARAEAERTFEGCEIEWDEVQVADRRGIALWKGCGGRWRETGDFVHMFTGSGTAHSYPAFEPKPRRPRPLPAWRA